MTTKNIFLLPDLLNLLKNPHDKLKLIKIKNHLSPTPQHVSNFRLYIFLVVLYVQLQQMFSFDIQIEKVFYEEKAKQFKFSFSQILLSNSMVEEKALKLIAAILKLVLVLLLVLLSETTIFKLMNSGEFLYENYGKYFSNEHENLINVWL